MIRDAIMDDNLQGVAWPRSRNGMQTWGDQTRYPTGGSTRKRGCGTFPSLGVGGSPPPEVLSLLHHNGLMGTVGCSMFCLHCRFGNVPQKTVAAMVQKD